LTNDLKRTVSSLIANCENYQLQDVKFVDEN